VAITKPTVGGSTNTWGTQLNTALDDLDTRVNTALRVGAIVFKARSTSTTTALADSTAAAIAFDIIDYDYFAVGLTATNTRYTPGLAGWYELTGGGTFAANVTGYRAAYWQINGTNTNGGGTQIAASGQGTIISARPTTVLLTATDAISLALAQGGNTTLNTAMGTSAAHGTLSVKYLGAG
jgi:hypothetical protein